MLLYLAIGFKIYFALEVERAGKEKNEGFILSA
jgi:hypothetical protein